jgi:hypothetical protein
MGNNNRLANRYWKKGLIILIGIWMFILLAAAGEAIHTRLTVPAHHRARVDLFATNLSLVETNLNLVETNLSLDRVSLQLYRVTTWALCLQAAQIRGPQLGSIDYLDVPAMCSDPR